MRIPIKKITIVVAAFLLALVSIQCSNPFKNEKKKELVLTFIDDYFPDTGRYVFYWDGKDDNNQYVAPGRYIILLDIKDWQDQEYVTAQKGGKPGANDRSHFEPGFWLSPDLEGADPDTFLVQSGTNIRVLLSEPSRVRIQIYKD